MLRRFNLIQQRALIPRRPFINNLTDSLFNPANEVQNALEKERVAGLQKKIKNEIRVAGFAPMSLARFMEIGLMDPQYGYYSTKDTIFNKGGDFTTSPEIS